jgi:hypothetical protein
VATPDEDGLAGFGHHEAGQELTDREPVLALHGLVLLEGVPIVAPGLVEPTRPQAVVLMADQPDQRGVDALERQEVVERQHLYLHRTVGSIPAGPLPRVERALIAAGEGSAPR